MKRQSQLLADRKAEQPLQADLPLSDLQVRAVPAREDLVLLVEVAVAKVAEGLPTA